MTWPFENDTSFIVNKLANKSIKADKRRNMFIIVTIAFAACLMTVLALYTFGKSHELKTFLQGRYQAAVIDVDMDTIEALKQDSNIEIIGKEVLIDSVRIDDYTLNINYRDSNDLYLFSIDLTGRLPEEKNEIAISSAYLEHINVPVKLNQEIELALQNGNKEKFTVCGIVNDDGANRRYQVLVSEPFLQLYYGDHIPYNATLRVLDNDAFNESDLKNLIKTCLQSYGISEEKIAYSSSYFDSVDNTRRDMLGVVAISIVIVIACSMVIYSLFYISVVGKVKEYGRLRVIGMTKKQIRRMVKKESQRLSLLSIPAGIIVGCLIGYILVPKGWNWLNTLLIVVGISILTELSVILSVRKPIKIASGVSPIEAVRISSTSDNEKVTTSKKLRRKLSPENLAKIGFMRNHKKVVLTFVSLGFSGILLMCAATFLSSIDEEDMARQSFGDKEFSVSLSDDYDSTDMENTPFNEGVIEQLLNSPYITDVTPVRSCMTDIYLPDKSKPSSFHAITGLSSDEFSKLSGKLLTGSVDYQSLVEDNGILIDDTADMLKTWEGYNIALGDVITVMSADGTPIELTVMGTIDMNNTDYSQNYFFVPINILSKIFPNRENFNTFLSVNADVKHLPEAEKAVLDTIRDDPNIQFMSFEDALSTVEMHITGIQYPIYGLIIFIGIFGIINLSNTLMTNLVSRQQEFGVLQSVGLSNKQLNKMLRMECLYYVFATMAITLVLGTITGYILCQIFSQVGILGKLHYTFPFLQVLVFFIVLIMISIVYSALAIHYCRKQSLVNRIKAMD